MSAGIHTEIYIATVTTPDGDVSYQSHSRDKAIEAVRRHVGDGPCARQIRVWRYRLDSSAGRAIAKPVRR